MKKNFRVICFDLDNVLCRTKESDYKNSKPIKNAIKVVNKLFINGYYIKIFTSRFMGRNNENVKKAKKQGFLFTKRQLKKWGVLYHELILGKPSYDLFIDDKNIFFDKKKWIFKLKNRLKFVLQNIYLNMFDGCP